MIIKDLIEIAKWKEIETLTRTDILELAGLPDNFELRDLPVFPSADEAERIVGWCFRRHQSGLTECWAELHADVKHYPKLVQQALLRSCNGRTKRIFPQWTAHGYGFDKQRYEDIVVGIKAAHTKIATVLKEQL